ncbi:MAG: hypothetical protein ABIG39_00220 [Candidatus Micrarchaeota archaeon]
MAVGVQAKPTHLFKELSTSFGPQHWWPARSNFEVAVGAILTQQTSWRSVEKAVKELRERKILSPKSLASAPLKEIESCIRPTGFYKQKAIRLKKLARKFPRINKLTKSLTLLELRAELLELDGVGKETADSILLYAFNLPVLPIDAYTHRITSRLYRFNGNYEELRAFYECSLPKDQKILNEFHALLVELAKRHCWKRKPDCGNCPVRGQCSFLKNNKLK